MRNIPALPLPGPLEKTAADYYLGATASDAAATLDRLVKIEVQTR